MRTASPPHAARGREKRTSLLACRACWPRSSSCMTNTASCLGQRYSSPPSSSPATASRSRPRLAKMLSKDRSRHVYAQSARAYFFDARRLVPGCWLQARTPRSPRPSKSSPRTAQTLSTKARSPPTSPTPSRPIRTTRHPVHRRPREISRATRPPVCVFPIAPAASAAWAVVRRGRRRPGARPPRPFDLGTTPFNQAPPTSLPRRSVSPMPTGARYMADPDAFVPVP